ncbi:MAG: molybdenum cofactor biosynthesis protein MoaE, partial [Gammaproteobacteria bacterium]|nr:molybdenum cofactor biosynthesis protein MoaE [Gammaproteobacteria bacterium]
MRVEVRDTPFDPWQAVRDFQSEMSAQAGKYGATATFVGTMRDVNQGNRVERMTLEHYPGMTEKCLNEISEKALERWDIADSLIIHRVGDLQPNEPIVLVAVWSAHRAAAFDACRYLIEELKSRA